MVQLSHPYMTTGKTIALTRQTFVDKVTSVLFNMMFRLVIAFLPRSKRLLISWLQSPSAVILEPKKIKSVTVSIVSPTICHEVMGLDAMIFIFWMLSFKPAFPPWTVWKGWEHSKYLFEFLLSVPLDLYVGLELLDHMVMLNFLKNHQTFPQQSYHVHSHLQCLRAPVSSYVCRYLLFSLFFFFNSSHSNVYELISYYGFDLCFPNDIEHLFMCLFVVYF